MGYTTIDARREGVVDWLTLDRPQRLNAINDLMIAELWDYFAGLQQDHGRRIVVLRGAGRAFCAGLDLKTGAPGNGALSDIGGPSLRGVVGMMRSCPQPIVVLIHGAACGGGMSFALAADIRIAGASAKMNVAYVKLGLTGCELGTSFHLPRTVGPSIAAELMMTGRFIHADRALATGLVSDVVPDDRLDDTARALIADMLRTSPMGLRKTKETLNLAMRLDDLDAVLRLEEHAQAQCMQGSDFAEAIAAFTERREPVFGSLS